MAAGRTACGYSLAELSDALRLQPFYLEALEREDRSSLPARPYVSGYVRSYALRVGLDPREANLRLQHVWPQEEEAINAAKALRFSESQKERRFNGRGLATIAVIALVAGYGFWYSEAVREQEPASLSPVAELEEPLDSADAAAPPDQQPDPVPEVVLGPLAPVRLPHLRAEYVRGLFDQPPSRPAARPGPAFEPLPNGPFPRPRPDTAVAQVWTRLYGHPSQAIDDAPAGHGVPAGQGVLAEQGVPAAQGVFAAQDGNQPGHHRRLASGGGLPAKTELSAYLPKLRLRDDLGPLNPQLPAVMATAWRQEPTSDGVAAEPVPYGRTQAFAAVPPGGDADPAGSTASGKHADAAATSPPAPDTISRKAEIMLTAAGAASWIEIRNGAGDVVLSRLLEAGQSVAVPEEPGLKLTTGNAGALLITVDGERAPALGKSGAVVRGVLLEPTVLLDRRG